MLMLFFALVGLTAVTRLFELSMSKRHRQLLVQQGARPVEERGFGLMVLLHVGVLAGAVFEVLVFERSVPPTLGIAAASGVLAASALRLWAIASLGNHWNVRVVDSTALGVVCRGPYRFIRHPNYVAVFVELTLLPLVQAAWATACVAVVLHVVVLKRRIALEEAVLLQNAGYRETMGNKPRFLPI